MNAPREIVLPNPERNPLDEFAAETVLKAVEYFLAAVADDFAEPDAAVHVHEERALVEASRLSMGDDLRVDEIVPDLDDFHFALPCIDAEVGHNLGHDLARGAGRCGLGNLHRSEIHATPLRKDP